MLEAKVSLLFSVKDMAGRNIAKYVISQGFREVEDGVWRKGDILVEKCENDSIFMLPKRTKAKFYVYLSRHSSAQGVPSLTAHTPGNWTSNANYGGRPEELGISNPYFQRAIMEEIMGLDVDMEKVLEVTHHGPTQLNAPLTFVEIGSSKKDWSNEKVAEGLANCVLNALKRFERLKKKEVVIGVGGQHYAYKITKYMLENDVSVAHIAPRYVLREFNLRMLEQAIEKTFGDVTYFVMDWKGSKRRKEIIEYIKDLGYECLRI